MKKGQRQVTIALMRNEIEYDAQHIERDSRHPAG